MRLMVEVGTGCEKLHNEQMQNLSCSRIQVDEIWSYVKVKQAHICSAFLRESITNISVMPANEDTTGKWFAENDPEGVAFERQVIGVPEE
jgi:hypothetical protein